MKLGVSINLFTTLLNWFPKIGNQFFKKISFKI